MPDEIIPTDGGESAADDSVILEDSPSLDLAPSGEVKDERGVSTKNVYAEMLRKLDRIERKYSQSIAEKDGIITDLQRRLMSQPVTSLVPEKKEYTKEELLTALSNTDDKDVQAQILDRLMDIKLRERDAVNDGRTLTKQQESWYQQQAVQQYPELLDQSSEFYRQTALALDRRIQARIVGPSSIWDAANEVAMTRPDLVKRQVERVPGRGFGDNGSRPSKRKDDDVVIDRELFDKWKREYPQLTEERIKARMRDIKKRML